MGGAGRDATAGSARVAPPARAPALDDALVVDVLARLAGADSCAAAVDAALPLLLELPSVRAAAVALRDGARAVLAGSAGYGCGTMAPGAVLPLDAGLPLTEAIRTGRLVVQGSGPSWVALPFGARAGALLLSMLDAPVQAPAELDRLQRIARGLGDALHRATRQQDATAVLEVVTARLAPVRQLDAATVRSLPRDGAAGGDLALCLPDGGGGRWLVIGDVCGAGLPAAVVAHGVRAALTALLPYVDGPAALLTAVDAAARASAGPGVFVTAAAVHASGCRLRVATAGHPPPLLLSASGARVVEVEPGLPLALEGQPPPASRTEVLLEVAPDDVLLLHSDGLLDRRDPYGPRTADPLALVAGRPLGDLEALADAVLAAADEVGAQGDDVTLLLFRALG